MSNLIKSEITKLRTIRTTLWFGIAILVLVLGGEIVGLVAFDNTVADMNRQSFGAAYSAGVFAMLFAVVAVTGEYRHKTITPSLLAAPDRWRLGLSKIVGYGLGAAVIGLLMQGAVIMTWVVWFNFDYGVLTFDDVFASMIATGVAGAGGAIIGIAVGELLRNQALGVSLSLVYFFIAEPFVAFWENGYRFTITGSLFSLSSDALTGTTSWWVGGLILLGWATILAALAFLLTLRRDVD